MHPEWLPPECYIGDNLLLNGCTSLHLLPKNLNIIGVLDLEECHNIEEILSDLQARFIIMPDQKGFKNVSDARDYCQIIRSKQNGTML